MISIGRMLLIVIVILAWRGSAFGQGNFGFHNTKPSGQPYLDPAESVKRFHPQAGWEVKLVAAEPDIINPIAFTVDEKGRLWVVECFEYPKRTPKGKKPRDRIKIIEETPQGPKVTIWAEGKDLPIGFDLASGIEVGNGGVYLGAPPYLFFLSDPENTGKCTKQEILLKGFGSQDTHEMLNTFQWGPDSKLYGLHGVFTQSEVRSGEPGALAPGVKLNAAIWRYDADAKPASGFEIFAEGTSNPWGMDFDKHGECFLACCVIPHLFHIIPGGNYIRQAGTSYNPYAYGQYKEICDHIHHKHSGWAHAGLLVLEGDHIPAAMRGSVIMGSIHGCSIQHDELRPNGSSYIGTHAPAFLESGDRNFRPINLRWGPDGSIYVIDWHDIYPCHQTPADLWDMTHGRIYKIRRTDAKPGLVEDVNKRSSKELVEILKENNPYRYRTALRLLHERKAKDVAGSLRQMVVDEKTDQVVALRALWALHAVGELRGEKFLAEAMLKHPSPWVRSWTIRLLGGTGKFEENEGYLGYKLLQHVANEKSANVRLQMACTAPSLKFDRNLDVLHALMRHKEDRNDPAVPLMLWWGYEPLLVKNPVGAMDWLDANAAGNDLITDEIVPRATRRLAAGGDRKALELSVGFFGDLKDSRVRLRALDGLTQGLGNRVIDPPPNWKPVAAKLMKELSPEIQSAVRRLAVHFRDRDAIAAAMAILQDAKRSVPERAQAVRDVALTSPPDARQVFLDILQGDGPLPLRLEACRALAGYDEAPLAGRLLGTWKAYPPSVRGEVIQLLAGRKPWAGELLTSVAKGLVPRTDLNDNTILRLRAFKDKQLNDLIEKHWGRFRDTPKELAELINKTRGQLYEGKASFTRGKLVFENQCAKCHKFEGKGHEVGPNLDGAARDIEYLLINVIDPNRVVGQPYYMRSVELKNGRIETGLLFAEDDMSITLKGENDVLKVISKKDIEGKVIVHEKSVMPEGLANNMTPQDFRDLIRYLMAHPFLQDVSIAGPLSWSPSQGDEPVGLRGVKWTAPVVGPPGRIALGTGKKGEAVSLVTANVTAPDANRTRLLLGSGQTVRVWLNDKLIYKGQPGTSPASPDQAGVDVELLAGVNHLICQVTHDGTDAVLFARFLDPDRRLRHGEK